MFYHERKATPHDAFTNDEYTYAAQNLKGNVMSVYAYVSNWGSSNVSVIDTSTNTTSATITVGNGPEGISITPDKSKVYVANFNDSTVSVINTSNNTVSKTVTVGTN